MSWVGEYRPRHALCRTLNGAAWLRSESQGNQRVSRGFASRFHLILVRPSGSHKGSPGVDGSYISKRHGEIAEKIPRTKGPLVTEYSLHALLFTNKPSPSTSHLILFPSSKILARKGKPHIFKKPVATVEEFPDILVMIFQLKHECVWLEFKQTCRFVAPQVSKISKNKSEWNKRRK